ncbi:predicted protein [Plenodomus lingam JN3]|uniref:Predicted protein n=1 Tax=Leptosphaeria maculans (strain JN3 / isolate v23.1.3 / race Av1-4-5-6-7-8) TaxID=985895 RepID=E4ZNM4_LEPMJ|nr:predicted protein [Plenodomus lingam JN3]CBX93243.1 predicted protein [Plenodomus lingam JN3]
MYGKSPIIKPETSLRGRMLDLGNVDCQAPHVNLAQLSFPVPLNLRHTGSTNRETLDVH